MKNDDFAYCADWDIIDAANTQAMRILIIGKPRSGKSTFAKSLSTKLDLIHINVDNWIATVYEKIKNYEPPELEENEVAP
jgi:adenylate/nucleoside-diphosphate kinase